MSIKSLLAKPFASYEVNRFRKIIANPKKQQLSVFRELIRKAAQTSFGKDHDFTNIKTYEDFRNQVPVRDYEGHRPYIEKIKEGGQDVLWPGQPRYFAKTSGTTSGTKYIPISKVSIGDQIRAARTAMLCYIHETKQTDFFSGKMIFIQGSPELDKSDHVDTGRLSGIVYDHVPPYLMKNRLPSYKTNIIEDWETKIDAIIDETLQEDMTFFSGIPPWVIMYFERLLERTGKKTVMEVFPNFNLYIHGGVNFQPYEDTFEKLIGRKIPMVETYPASEGFIAFQDSQQRNDLILNLDGGIFYEFIEVDKFFNDNAQRIPLWDVKVGVNYVLIMSTNAGLWAYNIGDTVIFTETKPYRLKVSGRIKHFISAFGEHVIGEEVESAISEVSRELGVPINEFTVAPMIKTSGELPFHEWFIEFPKDADIQLFACKLDGVMQAKNSYYKDLIEGKILQPLKITAMRQNAFRNYMESIGKLGGQNKIPRLSNDRKIADQLLKFKKSG